MGKYSTKKNRLWLVIAVIILILIITLLIWVAKNLEGDKVPELPQSTGPTGRIQEEISEATTVETETAPQDFESIALGQGLEVTMMGSYAGIFMEDGSDDIVSDVMMIVLKNSSGADLQLARIDLIYEEFTAEFEVTNLPAGESAVLLEKNRRSDPGRYYKEAEIGNVVFFREPMTVSEDKFEISTSQGSIDLTNTSGTDIPGEIFIYYKNSASDLLYGGITYRVRIEEGLAAGETARIMTRHFDPDNSRILNIVCGE